MKPFYIGLTLVSIPDNHGLHASGRRILEHLNEECFPGSGPAEIGIEPGGRPFFTAHHADFSISHSRNMAAVAYWAEKDAETGRPLRTGCDIQHIKPLKNFGGIAHRYFSPEEQDYIAAASGGPEGLERFYRIWVLKECFLKARGLSVFDMKTTPSFAGPDSLTALTNVPLRFFLYELGEETAEKYLLAAARESSRPDGPSPEIRWYPAPLPLRSIAVIQATPRSGAERYCLL
jgi:phosphopantetheinyl transferase (holo-ACP synthase)